VRLLHSRCGETAVVAGNVDWGGRRRVGSFHAANYKGMRYSLRVYLVQRRTADEQGLTGFLPQRVSPVHRLMDTSLMS
jgi:hypothetical protein